MKKFKEIFDELEITYLEADGVIRIVEVKKTGDALDSTEMPVASMQAERVETLDNKSL